MKIILLSATLSLVVLCGCARTVIGGLGYSPDKQHILFVKSYGAAGKAYTDTSKKQVVIRIAPRENETRSLVTHEHTFAAAGLNWRIFWSTTNDVAVEFFDYGEKVSVHDPRRGPPSNYIATLRFQRDPISGIFSESK